MRYSVFHKEDISLLPKVHNLYADVFSAIARGDNMRHDCAPSANFVTLPVFRQSIMCIDLSAFLKVFLIFDVVFLFFVILFRHWYSSYYCFLEIVC